MKGSDIIDGEMRLRKWARRRPYTLVLTLFFLGWYLLQLSLFHLVGKDVARWWFYFEQPPNSVSPGILFAPISHDFDTLKHIGSNIFLFLFAGSVSEPYIGKDRIMITVMGLGYLGTYLANWTVILHKMWMVAGASGGILSLWAYAGLRMRSHATETPEADILLLGIPAFMFHQTLLIKQPHSGHIIGLLLGCLYYGLESTLGGSETALDGNT